MKTFYLFLLFPCLLIAQIPNPGFENWGLRNGIPEPDGWTSNNEVRAFTPYDTLRYVEPSDSIKSEGNYSLFIRPLQFGSSVVASGTVETKISPPKATDALILKIKIPQISDYRSGISAAVEDVSSGIIFSDALYDSVIPNFLEWKIPFSFNPKPDTIRISISFGCYGMNAYPDGAFVDEVSLQSTISQTEYSYDNLKIYPNPVEDYLTIHTELDITQTLITDLHGKTLYHNHTFQKEISMSIFPKGVYILHFIGPDVNISKKIIKE